MPSPQPKDFKGPPLGVRLDPGDHAALIRLAEADDRPVSALMRKILVEWIRRQEEKAAKSAEWRARRP